MAYLSKTKSPELDLTKAQENDRRQFAKVEVPVVTISSTYRKELADKYNTLLANGGSDVVFSRAHYSMAEAVRQAAKMLGKTVHLTDPTNYVTLKDWKKVEFTETMGQLIARYKLLKWIKDKIDTVVRDKLPIANAIADPLEFMSKDTPCPIISLHYEAGNQLVKLGHTVVQVVTDPHIRPQYLYPLPSEKITYAVFDEDTKKQFFRMAADLKRNVNENQVIVTGPPVDPRVAKAGLNKKELTENRPLRLAICTGGLGQNLKEIKEVLRQLTPLLKPEEKIQLFLYAGTHRDFRDLFENYAREQNIRVGNLDETNSDIRILYDDSIIDANNNLVKYMFPWADGVITKPSGDMAYDAAASGCFLLFLEPWGEWEEEIQKRFVKWDIGRDFNAWCSHDQIIRLWTKGFFSRAIKNAHSLPSLFRQGSKNIVILQQTIPCRDAKLTE